MRRFLRKVDNSFRVRAGRLSTTVRDALHTVFFIRHNRKYFSIDKRKGNSIVLLELNGLTSSIIAYSYLAGVLSRKYDARLIAYQNRLERRFVGLRWLLGKYKVVSNWFVGSEGVYRSFGVSEFITPRLSDAQRATSTVLAKSLFSSLRNKQQTSLRNKQQIEDVRVRGVCIGDLIYDTYLKKCRKPTIAINDPDFFPVFLTCIQLAIFWDDYCGSENIRAINVSHCVYVNAIPARYVLHHGGEGFQVTAASVYRMSINKPFAYADFFQYKKTFRELSASEQKEGVALAKQRVDRRFDGEIGVDMPYSIKTAFGRKLDYRVVRESSKVKVLIGTHCFFDSPHSYGNNLFPDFFEWIEFLGAMTKETDYDWYIKTHADYFPGTMQIVEEFISRFPKFTLVPPDTSHLQLIDEGIDVALTVHGTMAFEYAALGVTAVTASVNNPYVDYSFTVSPLSLEEYKRVLKGLGSLNHVIRREEVYEYYFMRHLYNPETWLIEDVKKIVSEVGGYTNQWRPVMYSAWRRQWTPHRHFEIVSAMESFCQSDAERMGPSHIAHYSSTRTEQLRTSTDRSLDIDLHSFLDRPINWRFREPTTNTPTTTQNQDRTR